MSDVKSLDIGTRPDGRTFRLPREIVTQTTAVLGIRGSGKTNTGTVIVEELLELGHHVVIVDPTDVWFGLASDYPVVVLGGDHADLPLEEGDGKTLADFAVERRAPMILSMRHLRKAAQRRFMSVFAEQLYFLKGAAEFRQPLLLVIDEASSYVPQRIPKGGERLVGAIEDIVRRGRASGFGIVLIDQRAATMNKDVLTQLEVLVAHRMTSPQDRKALDEWVKAHDTHGHREVFLRELASLDRGEAYFWSPGLDIFEAVQVSKRRTFDSSRTPAVGERLSLPSRTEIDLDALKEQLGATIERARAEDPNLLRQRIRELEQELRAAGPSPEEIERRVEAATAAAENRIREYFEPRIDQATDLVQQLATVLQNGEAPPAPITESGPPAPREMPVRKAPAPASRPRQRSTGSSTLSPPRQRMLDALARLEALGIESVSRNNLAVWSEQSPKSSAYMKNVSVLNSEGLIRYPSPGVVSLLKAGRELAEPGDPIRSVDELHDAWRRVLRGDAQRRTLNALIDAWPDEISRDELAERSGQSPRSSAFMDHVSTLKSFGVAEYPSAGYVRATEMLFPPALAARPS